MLPEYLHSCDTLHVPRSHLDTISSVIVTSEPFLYCSDYLSLFSSLSISVSLQVVYKYIYHLTHTPLGPPPLRGGFIRFGIHDWYPLTIGRNDEWVTKNPTDEIHLSWHSQLHILQPRIRPTNPNPSVSLSYVESCVTNHVRPEGYIMGLGERKTFRKCVCVCVCERERERERERVCVCTTWSPGIHIGCPTTTSHLSGNYKISQDHPPQRGRTCPVTKWSI
jgi:hypothetical protein